MKKVIISALFATSVISAANAMDITSPLYMPKRGDSLVELRAGVFEENYKYDRYSGATATTDYDGKRTASAAKGDMSFGMRDDWSFNFGFYVNTDTEIDNDYATDSSDYTFGNDTDFKNTYFGFTKRFLDKTFKFDILAKLWMQNDSNTYANSNLVTPYPGETGEIAARIGFNVEDIYTTAVTLAYQYVPEDKSSIITPGTHQEYSINRMNNGYARWENQINPVAGLEIGVNGEYRRIDEYKRIYKSNGGIQTGTTESYLLKRHDAWIVDGDVGYNFAKKYVVAAYAEYKAYEDVPYHTFDALGNASVNPYSTDKDRDSVEYGLKTYLKF